MTPEEHDDLWELLGRAQPPKASPFFARNVLRRIREEDPERVGIMAWLRLRWPLLAGASCLVVLAGISFWPKPAAPTEPAVVATEAVTTTPAVAQVAPAAAGDSLAELAEVLGTSPDFAVIGNLDELLAAEESSAWLTHPVF